MFSFVKYRLKSKSKMTRTDVRLVNYDAIRKAHTDRTGDPDECRDAECCVAEGDESEGEKENAARAEGQRIEHSQLVVIREEAYFVAR